MDLNLTDCATTGRKENQQTRHQDPRSKIGAKVLPEYTDQWTKELFSGLEEEELKCQEISESTVDCPIPISTRVIGLSIQDTFIKIAKSPSAARKIQDINPHWPYQVLLAQHEQQVIRNQQSTSLRRNAHIQGLPEPPELAKQNAALAGLNLTLTGSAWLYACSKTFKSEGTNIVPVYPAPYYIAGQFVPVAQSVTFSNLRDTVRALSNQDTPAVHRKAFYDANPIPTARWNIADPQSPLLINADEIMPEQPIRNLGSRVADVKSWLCNISDWQKKLTRQLDRTSPGNPGVYLSCDFYGAEPLRCADVVLTPQGIIDWRSIEISGSIFDFWSKKNLTKQERLIGALALAGERPNVANALRPIWSDRNYDTRVQNAEYDWLNTSCKSTS